MASDDARILVIHGGVNVSVFAARQFERGNSLQSVPQPPNRSCVMASEVPAFSYLAARREHVRNMRSSLVAGFGFKGLPWKIFFTGNSANGGRGRSY